jgi:hypothetical protein
MAFNKVCLYINAPEGCRHGTHTQMGRPTYEAPTREYTHKHTQTHKHTTERGPTKYGADSRRGGALLIRGGRLAQYVYNVMVIYTRSFACRRTSRSLYIVL